MDCIDQNCTYAAPLQVKLRLRLELEGQSKPFYSEEEIFMGELPIVTERGSFIINGAERVVVSQLHRSPGVSFEESMHTSGKTLHGFRIIPIAVHGLKLNLTSMIFFTLTWTAVVVVENFL